MRVFHVSDCYAPRTGGIESQVRDLARAQVSAGHEVHVLTATPGEGGERGGVREADDGVVVHRLGTHVPFDLPVNPAAPPMVRRLLEQERPDVVHVHAGVLSPFAYDGARVALDAAVATVVTWHCMLDGAVPVLRGLVSATRWRAAPVVLSAVSAAAAERVRSVFGRHVDVVHNGMDMARWRPSSDRPRTGLPLRAVATMRLAPRKRGLPLLGLVEDALTQVPHGSLRLDVLGDGPQRAAMERCVRRRRLGDVVHLRGRVPREEVRRAYDDADVFLAPATLEAFGIAALEARTAGLLVIGRRGTGVEDFLTHEVDGLLVDDDAAMARALAALVHDGELRARLGAAARASAPALGWDVVVAEADRLYRRARTLQAA